MGLPKIATLLYCVKRSISPDIQGKGKPEFAPMPNSFGLIVPLLSLSRLSKDLRALG
jgi:hypothetical protein